MKLNNIHGFGSIDGYVKYKIAKYSKREKSLESLFELMFDESDNTMLETSDGYRITRVSYGEYKRRVLAAVPTVAELLSDLPHGSMVGLYMSNSPEWLAVFWAILASGYSPLVMNTRLPDAVLERVLCEHSVSCVISDGKQFSVRTLSAADAIRPSSSEFAPHPFGEEVIFMSSGTTDNVKLCAYNGENFYYQICDSARIIEKCPKIKQHYKGELKQLVLLPLCHVFGFIAVYLWFGFFARTFVFPRDLNPDTVRKTVLKHGVTHIFAVPMVWEAVHKAALRRIRERGEATYSRFIRVSRLVNRLDGVGDLLARRLLSEVRAGLFGDSIRFLITGGSHIKRETLEFFNGIGYHLVNGYGMTEIGITSVERSGKKRIASSASIGAPFGFTEYSIGESGELSVRGRTRAARIMQGGKVRVTDYGEWFPTGDIMRCEGGRYYFSGREDDLIVGVDGENINPLLVEGELDIPGIDAVALLSSDSGLTLIASLPGVFSQKRLGDIYSALTSRLGELKLSASVRRILFTHEPLLREGEFKLSRTRLAARLDGGELRCFDPAHADEHVAELSGRLESELADCFAEALGRDASTVGAEDDFFRELEGTSLDYFSLLGIIRSRLGVDVTSEDGARLTTVKGFADYVKKILKDD